MPIMRLKRFIIAGFFCLGGCSNEEIRIDRVPKETMPAVESSFNPADAQLTPREQGPPEPAALHWDLPPGWREKPASGMRVASFDAVSDAGAVDVSVIFLPGDAGGEMANVNRWRSQVGLEAWDEKAYSAQSRRIKTPAGTVVFVDFTGTTDGVSTRLLAGILTHNGHSWFFKAMGPEQAAAGIRPAFLKFLESIHEAH